MSSELLLRLFGVLVYPGAVSIILFTLAAGRILGGAASGGLAFRGLAHALRGHIPPAFAAAAVLALVALSQLPWPRIPWQPHAVAHPWLLWGLMEASALLMLLPGLLSPLPLASRTAVRELQLGISGRLPLWIGLGLVLENVAGIGQQMPPLMLLTVPALLAFSAAANWAPFDYAPFSVRGDAITLYPASTHHFADEVLALAQWARRVQAIFWITLIATVFVALPALTWWIALLLRLGIVVALALLARGLRGTLLNRPLVTALRWCWWLVVPLMIVWAIGYGR